MDFVYIVLILMIIFSFILIVSFFKKSDDKKMIETKYLENLVERIEKSIDDADYAISEVNSLSIGVFDEFKEKHGELLFLYKLIEEKKNNFEVSLDVDTQEYKEGIDKTYNHPKLSEIIRLQSIGLSDGEIARVLNIGIREIELILELGKVKNL